MAIRILFVVIVGLLFLLIMDCALVVAFSQRQKEIEELLEKEKPADEWDFLYGPKEDEDE